MVEAVNATSPSTVPVTVLFAQRDGSDVRGTAWGVVGGAATGPVCRQDVNPEPADQELGTGRVGLCRWVRLVPVRAGQQHRALRARRGSRRFGRGLRGRSSLVVIAVAVAVAVAVAEGLVRPGPYRADPERRTVLIDADPKTSALRRCEQSGDLVFPVIARPERWRDLAGGVSQISWDYEHVVIDRTRAGTPGPPGPAGHRLAADPAGPDPIEVDRLAVTLTLAEEAQDLAARLDVRLLLTAEGRKARGAQPSRSSPEDRDHGAR